MTKANKAVIKFGAVDGFQKAISKPIVTGMVRVPFAASESMPAPLDQGHADSTWWTDVLHAESYSASGWKKTVKASSFQMKTKVGLS